MTPPPGLVVTLKPGHLVRVTKPYGDVLLWMGHIGLVTAASRNTALPGDAIIASIDVRLRNKDGETVTVGFYDTEVTLIPGFVRYQR